MNKKLKIINSCRLSFYNWNDLFMLFITNLQLRKMLPFTRNKLKFKINLNISIFWFYSDFSYYFFLNILFQKGSQS